MDRRRGFTNLFKKLWFHRFFTSHLTCYMMLFQQWRQKLTLPSDQTIEVRSNLLIKSLKWLLLKWFILPPMHNSSSSVIRYIKKSVSKQSFTLSLWLVKITSCWKIHLSYRSKFYEQPWLQERTWKDQLQRKNVSYRISFSKFVPSEFNLQLPSQLISRHLRLRGLIEKACDTRAHHSIIVKLHILVKSFQNFLGE